MPNPFRKKDGGGLDFSSVVRSARRREHHPLKRWWAKALVIGVSLLVLLVGAGVAGYYYLQGQLREKIPGIVDPPTRDNNEGEAVPQPFNVLLVGSDSREGLTEKEQQELGANPVEGERADTLILAHVDPATGRITMVQFPRDLWVPILDEGDGRINSALEKGRGHLVKAFTELTGLEVHRYIQVNIAGFKEVVDALGGVDICITDPIPFDPQTGIEITAEELGMVHFDGELALRFVRTRKTLEEGDLDRIQNQQRFLAAALDKALSTRTLIDIGRLRRLFRAAGDNVVIDDKTTLFDLRDLAQRFRSFDPDTYEAYTVPNRGPGFVGEASVVLPDPEAMEVMFEAIRTNRSPHEVAGGLDIDPAKIRVGVYNGTGVDGEATKATKQLVGATRLGESELKIVEVANATSDDLEQTVIRFSPEARDQAELIARALPDAKLQQRKVPRKVDVQVLVGDEFETERVIQIQPIPLPRPSDPPEECR